MSFSRIAAIAPVKAKAAQRYLDQDFLLLFQISYDYTSNRVRTSYFSHFLACRSSAKR